jgi:hypothetical protein
MARKAAKKSRKAKRKTGKKAAPVKETGCCPRFDPKPWDGKVFRWEGKRFVKVKVLTLFHIPVGFGNAVRMVMKKMDAAGAKSPDWMGLSDHTSMWNMDVYISTDKNVPGLENTTISGKFLSKVYEGPFKDTGKWCKDFAEYARKRKMRVKKMYMWYTTCPKCAKVYGKNYVVIVARV